MYQVHCYPTRCQGSYLLYYNGLFTNSYNNVWPKPALHGPLHFSIPFDILKIIDNFLD